MCGQSAGLKNQRFVGSTPTAGTISRRSEGYKFSESYVGVVQLVEHSTDNRKVTGSIPVLNTKRELPFPLIRVAAETHGRDINGKLSKKPFPALRMR